MLHGDRALWHPKIQSSCRTDCQSGWHTSPRPPTETELEPCLFRQSQTVSHCPLLLRRFAPTRLLDLARRVLPGQHGCFHARLAGARGTLSRNQIGQFGSCFAPHKSKKEVVGRFLAKDIEAATTVEGFARMGDCQFVRFLEELM